MDAVENLLRSQRTNLSRLVEWITDFQRAHSFDKLAQKNVVNFVGNKKSLSCDARLTAVDRSGFNGSSKCAFEIRARHDDERVAAAELEDSFFNFARGCAGDSAARFLAAGKRDRFHAWIDNYVFHLLRLDEQRLKYAFVKTGAPKDLFDRECALRHVGRMFEETDVSRH